MKRKYNRSSMRYRLSMWWYHLDGSDMRKVENFIGEIVAVIGFGMILFVILPLFFG